jgi:hypothetical protein
MTTQTETARILEERGQFIKEIKEIKEGKHTDHVMNALRLAALDAALAKAVKK